MAAKPNLIKGDTVMIRRGKEKGKRGIVKAVLPEGGSATVEGLNVVKRHTKQGAQQQSNMGAPAERRHLRKGSADSVVCAACTSAKSATRRRACVAATTEDGAPHRVCAKCGEPARESAKGA